MASYAEGRKAFGFCDRCGFRYNLKDLKTETVNLATTNLLVCPECWDPDHPQNMLGRVRVDDPQALRNPRPLGGISGRDLPAAYRWDFSTGTAQTSPTRIDGWWASNGIITWNSSSETLNLVSNPDSSNPGDPYLHRGWNFEGANDWLSIDASTYKFVVSSFKVNRLPDFEPDDIYFQDFQGQLFWAIDTSPGPYSTWPYSPDRSQISQHKPVFTNAQTSDGFSTENRNMASQFKIVWDMSNNPNWSGTLTGLRLDYFHAKNTPLPGPDYDAGDIDINYIEVVAFHNPNL
jgi:hypothetical protein